MLETQPVSVIYATAPIRKPKPIKLITDPDGRIQSVPHTPVQPLPPPNRYKRPPMVRAATLDGRSLSEVIDAAHRASLNEQSKSRSSKSPTSAYDTPTSSSRRTSFYYPPLVSCQSSNFHPQFLSYGNRVDIALDPFGYDGLA